MEITEAQYRRIEHCFPRQRGNVSISNLQVLNAILCVAEHGCKWRGLPPHFGNRHTIYTRMNRPRALFEGSFPTNDHERKNTELIQEFNRYVREHPRFAERIPNDAAVGMQLEGDEAFNAWAQQLAEQQRAEGLQVVFVRIKKLRPRHSRIEQLQLEPVA